MSALDDRRQLAREAWQDAAVDPDPDRNCVEAAIETATRVRITHEVVMAFIEAPDGPDDIAAPLVAAFRAAGFEVEE